MMSEQEPEPLATDGVNSIYEGPEDREHIDFVLRDDVGQEYHITNPSEMSSIASLLSMVAHEAVNDEW